MHRKCKPRSLGQNVKILAARFCSTRMLTIHGSASQWFIWFIPGKNMGKAILGGFFHLKACWFLHVTSRPARGLPRCKQHCFQYATSRTSTKEANEPKAALRPKGCPEKSSSIPEKLYETSVLENRQRWNMRNHNFHVKHVGATCCRRLRCLHTSAWWPRSDSLPGFLLTSYERNATGKFMERAVSCIQRASASHKPFQKDDGHVKTVCVLRVAARVLHWSTLENPVWSKASNESKNGANISNSARDSNVTGAKSQCRLSLWHQWQGFRKRKKQNGRNKHNRRVLFTLLRFHCHASLRTTRSRTHLHSKESCECHLAFQVSRTNSVALSGHQEHIYWLFDRPHCDLRCCGRKVLYFFKLTTMLMVEEMLCLILIYYWLLPDTKMTRSSKPNRSEHTKLYWKYSPGTSLQIVYNLQF